MKQMPIILWAGEHPWRRCLMLGVVYLFAERLPGGRGFHMHCLPAPDGVADTDDEVAATAMNQGVENCIHICPEQYLWAYRRFRYHPENAGPYKGPSI